MLAVTALVLAPARAGSAGTGWQGNYDTCDFSQWLAVEALPGDAVIVPDLHEGPCGAQFTVNPGDNPIASSGERAEVYTSTGEGEGTESWWAWSVMFPNGFNAYAPSQKWNIFTQWHNTGTACSPSNSFYVDTHGSSSPADWTIGLRGWGGPLDTTNCTNPYRRDFVLAPFERNTWYDIVFHVKWSSDPSVGFYEVWIDGRLALPKTYVANLYTGQGVYLKQGFYRDAAPVSTTLFEDGMVRGDSYDAVSQAAFGTSTDVTPSNTAPPAIAGSPAQGQTLTAATGTWAGSPSSYAYQWRRCDSSGGACADLADATGQDYVPGAADVGSTLRVSVTAANLAGSASAVSAPTGVIQPAATLTASSTPAGFDAVVTDPGCAGCAVVPLGDGFRATIQGGLDSVDTAFALKDFGGTAGMTGGTDVHDSIGLAQGQTLHGNLAVLQVRDLAGKLVYELYVDGGDRTLSLWSPAGGLASSPINASTGVVVPNDGSSRLDVDVSALANDSVSVRVGGVVRIVRTGLQGATTGNQRYLRAGIDHYDTSSATEPVSVLHGPVSVGSSTSPTATGSTSSGGSGSTGGATWNAFSSIANGQTLSGRISWTAAISGVSTDQISQVVFSIDGTPRWTEHYVPYYFGGDYGTLDTTTLADGSHSFTVTATAADGTSSQATATATVANGSASTSSQPAATTSDSTASSFSASSSIGSGQKLSGRVPWTATVSGIATDQISEVDFLVDGALRWTEHYAPYTYDGDGNTLDTTTLADGTHTFAVKAVAADGSSATSSASALVANG